MQSVDKPVSHMYRNRWTMLSRVKCRYQPICPHDAEAEQPMGLTEHASSNPAILSREQPLRWASARSEPTMRASDLSAI